MVSKNNDHDGVIFIVSSHGDRDKIIYDSNCDEFELETIFGLFTPEYSLFVDLYQETKEESNHLFCIPKLFLIDR